MGIGGTLGRRVIAAEGGYFASRSREAISGLRKKQQNVGNKVTTDENAVNGVNPMSDEIQSKADVLPEILQHSTPPGFGAADASESPSPVDRFTGVMRKDADEDRSLIIGPRNAWVLAREPVYKHPSTANDMRTDAPAMSPAQAKLVIEGYLMIVKAFFVATAIVFGGTVIGVKIIKTRLDIQSLEDIPVRGQEILRPRVEGLREMLEPIRSRVHGIQQEKQVKLPSEEERPSTLREPVESKY